MIWLEFQSQAEKLCEAGTHKNREKGLRRLPKLLSVLPLFFSNNLADKNDCGTFVDIDSSRPGMNSGESKVIVISRLACKAN